MSKTPLKIKLAYAAGQFGWSLAAYAATNLITYFYLPPETDEISFPIYFSQAYIFGVLTLVGIISSSGRIIDFVTDPFIAHWSDNSKSKMGKRRFFMAIGSVPFALFSVLVFTPILGYSSTINAIWLAICLAAFYFFMTVYVIPYNSWIYELGKTQNERLEISTLISFTWIVGFAVGQSIFSFKAMLSSHFSDLHAFQICIVAFAILALIFMLFPVLFIDESKHCIQRPNDQSKLFSSLKRAFKNPNLRIFVLSDLTYWLAVYFIQMGMVYYVTILLDLEESVTTTLMLMVTVCCLVIFYLPVYHLGQKWGKKRVQLLAYLIFLLCFGCISIMGLLNIPTNTILVCLVILAAAPIASFGILPNAIMADIIEESGQRTGNYEAGIFYAIKNFMMKIGIALANIIFPSLLLLGKSQENDFGVRLTAVAGIIFLLIGALVFSQYKELNFESKSA